MKKTVTIGIPAYNEEKTITQLLAALHLQYQKNYMIKKIIILCDGSTDGTAKIARALTKKYPLLSVIVDTVNRGKSYRLNQLFAKAQSDIVIIFDADTIIYDRNLIATIVSHFASDTIGLVAADDLPLDGTTFFSHIVYAAIGMWHTIRTTPNYLASVHNSHGCLLALRRNLYKKITIPQDVLSDDEWLYFACRQHTLDFHFAQNAHIYYAIPATLSDYITQSRRFLHTKNNIFAHFGNEIKKSYTIDIQTKLKGISIAFIQSPFYTSLAFLLQAYLRITDTKSKAPHTTWERITSTKL